VGKAVTGVGEDQFGHAVVFVEAGLDGEDAEQAVLHGLGGVVDEVGEGALQGLGGDHDGGVGGGARRGLGVDSAGGERGVEALLDADLVQPAVEEGYGVFDDPVEVV